MPLAFYFFKGAKIRIFMAVKNLRKGRVFCMEKFNELVVERAQKPKM
jgi:hypothetical protein